MAQLPGMLDCNNSQGHFIRVAFSYVKMSNVVILIDGGYIEKILKNEFANTKIDYVLLSEEIRASISTELDILRTYYYHSLPYKGNPPTKEESERFARKQKFFNALNRKPRFEVKLGRLVRIGPDEHGSYYFEQKMVDALLSIDLVHLSATGKITHAALVAGDGDFVPAMKVAKNDGVSLWLVHGKMRHKELWETADERMELNEKIIKKIKLR